MEPLETQQKTYIAPEIVVELDLETRAGTTHALPDPLDLPEG